MGRDGKNKSNGKDTLSKPVSKERPLSVKTETLKYRISMAKL